MKETMKPDFTQMNVAEIRQLYCERLGVSMEQAEQIKPKSALVAGLEKTYPQNEPPKIDVVNSPFSLAQIEEARVQQNHAVDCETVPERGSPEWQEYLLSLLTEDEYVLKDNKRYPKASGLRRLVEKLLGDILHSGPKHVFPPNNTTGGNATIVYEITIAWREAMGQPRTFSEVADGGPSNTPAEYAVHASATAASRAAGRAFRSALLLSINTAEEMNNVVGVTNGPTDDIRLLNEPSSTTQHVGIRTVANRLNISVDALLQHNNFSANLEKLTKVEAQNLLLQLSQFSSGSLEIPDSIKEPKV